MRRFVGSTAPGAEEWVFGYTADDERVLSMRVGGSGEKWTIRGLDNQILREIRANEGVHALRDYVWSGRELLSKVERTPSGGSWTETTLHAATDHLATPRILKESGSAAISHIYYPFGQELTTSTDTERIKFTGHERDLWNTTSTADDLDYMHARHYNPQLARFFQVDPLAGVATQPQSLNRYAYVMGSPIGSIDPSGMQTYQCIEYVYYQRGDRMTDEVCFWDGGHVLGREGTQDGSGPGGRVNPTDPPPTVPPTENPETDDEEECTCSESQEVVQDGWQNVADFSAGFGDSLLLTGGDELRDASFPAEVNEGSTAYRAGGWASFAVGAGRAAYAIGAKAVSIFAKTGVAASAMRTQLKTIGRLGFGRTWRQPDLRGLSDAAIRAKAGRTNPLMNAYGAGVAVSGAANGTCGCP
jgi:RHS repeat-associated protein